MVTSWIFGEVSVAPDLAGQPIVGQGVFISNPTANPIAFGILFGLWAADGPDGGPGTLLNVGLSGMTPFPPSFNYESVDSGFPTPAGNFWVSYAFENYATPTTTAAELDSLEFDMGTVPTVGTSVGTALLGSAASYPLGNDPVIAGPASGALAQFLQVETPEPSSALFGAIGLLLLATELLLPNVGGSEVLEAGHLLLFFRPVPDDFDVAGTGHGVVRGNLEYRGRRLAAIDVGQFISRRASARIAALIHDRYLQLGRIPALRDDNNGLLVADLPRRNRHRRARAFGSNAFYRLGAKMLNGRLGLRGVDFISEEECLRSVARIVHDECPRLRRDRPQATTSN